MTKKEDDEEFKALCTLIGAMALSWAWAEICLGVTVGIINKYAGPLKNYSEAPLMLGKRVKYLREALNKLTVLNPVKKDGLALAERFMQLRDSRNHFIHGAAWKHADGSFQFTNMGIVAGNYTFKDKGLNITDAIELNIKIGKLSDDASAYMSRVTALFS
ncbi:MAG: hypothetical protein WBR15_05885 [Gammaproteobacteria bacterium]